MPDVIIPVLDEAAALPALLSAMPPGYRAIVVDNGSADGSGAIAASYGAMVVTEPVRGFGSACWAGLLAADPDDGVVCFMDGDGSLDPGDLPSVAADVLGDRADLVLGARRPTTAGAWPVHARVANAVLAVVSAVLSPAGRMPAGSAGAITSRMVEPMLTSRCSLETAGPKVAARDAVPACACASAAACCASFRSLSACTARPLASTI